MLGLFKKKKIQNLHIPHKQVESEDFEKFIIYWNNLFPIDYWYRSKYNIKFNSPEHRELSFIDMLFEFREKKIFDNIFDESNKYTPGDYIKKSEDKSLSNLSNEAMMEAFHNLDLSNFDD
jgi:hypothetical protein